MSRQLDELLSDEKKSELVFDAYRSVCLSRSKDLGPRVIALLTAELLVRQSEAGTSEFAIFSVAEGLLDFELAELSEYVLSAQEKAMRPNARDYKIQPDGSIRIQIGDEIFDSNWPQQTSSSVAPLDLNEIGTWAPKVKAFGLVSDDVQQREYAYQEDSERHVDMPGKIREITWWLTLSKTSRELAELIRRARVDNGIPK